MSASPSTSVSLTVTVVVALASACSASSPPTSRPMASAPTDAPPLPDRPSPDAGSAPAADVAPSSPIAPEAAATAWVRVIHASPDPAAAPVDVALGREGAVATGLVFRGVAGLLRASPGEHEVALRAAGDASDAPPLVRAVSPALVADRTYTVVAHGLAADATAPRALTVAIDDDGPLALGAARVRFFHAVAGLGVVDLCTAAEPARRGFVGHPPMEAIPVGVVVSQVAYGTFSAYVPMNANQNVTLQLREHAARPCTGRVRASVLTAAWLGASTLVATGRIAAPPNRVPLALVMCHEREATAFCRTEALR